MIATGLTVRLDKRLRRVSTIRHGGVAYPADWLPEDGDWVVVHGPDWELCGEACGIVRGASVFSLRDAFFRGSDVWACDVTSHAWYAEVSVGWARGPIPWNVYAALRHALEMLDAYSEQRLAVLVALASTWMQEGAG